MQFLEQNTGGNFSDIGYRNIFPVMCPLATETKAKLTYWDYTNKTKQNKTKQNKTKQNTAFIQWRKPSTKPKGNLLNGRKYLQ